MKAVTKFLQLLQLYLYRSAKQFKNPDAPFNICDKIQQVKVVLICLPNDPASTPAAIAAIKELQQVFQKWNITVVAADNLVLTGLRRIDIIRRTERDTTSFGRPKKMFLQNVLQTKYDLVIDLSPEFNFTNLSLAWNSNADLRIGFYLHEREDLYNFLLRPKSDASPDQAFRMLVNTLKSL